MKEKKRKEMRLRRINKRFLLNNPSSLKLYPLIKKVSTYSMLPYGALYQAYRLVQEIKNVPGDIVEMGCWNGGCGALMAYSAKKSATRKKVWLFDSFEGIPTLTKEDEAWARKSHLSLRSDFEDLEAAGYYVADVNLAKEVIKKLEVEDVCLIQKGWFQRTIPEVKENIGPIALLRLDGDLYESTKYCLEQVYDLVFPGGIIIIDDFNLEGCRQALFEFFYSKKHWPFLTQEIGERMYFRKT